MPRDLAEPRRSFLVGLDGLVEHDVRLHCCGGFVVTMLYGLARTTADLDVLSILPTEDQRTLAALAGQGTSLHLDVAVLRERYQREMRDYVGVPKREDLTLDLWIDIIQEAQQTRERKK